MKDRIYNIGSISLPFKYEGSTRWPHWIGYAFAFLSVTLVVGFLLYQFKKVGLVTVVFPAEPIDRAMTSLDVKNRYFEGGIHWVPLDSIPSTANKLNLYDS